MHGQVIRQTDFIRQAFLRGGDGHYQQNPVCLLNREADTVNAGLYPFCSCPSAGSRPSLSTCPYCGGQGVFARLTLTTPPPPAACRNPLRHVRTKERRNRELQLDYTVSLWGALSSGASSSVSPAWISRLSATARGIRNPKLLPHLVTWAYCMVSSSRAAWIILYILPRILSKLHYSLE